MTKDAINQYSTIAANNTDIGGININTGWSPANVGPAVRELMAQLADVNTQVSAWTGGTFGTINSTGTITGIALSAGTGPVNCGAITATGAISSATGHDIFSGGNLSTSGAISSTGGGQISTTGTISGGVGTFTGKVTAANGAAGTDLVNWSQFANSAASSGYQKLPGGIIIQWGLSVLTVVSGFATITYPISFPTGGLTGVVCNGDAAADTRVDIANGNNPGQFTIGIKCHDISSGTVRVNWIVVGH